MTETTVKDILAGLKQREEHCWLMVKVFMDNRDAHGVMDMGAELQSLDRATKEVEKING